MDVHELLPRPGGLGLACGPVGPGVHECRPQTARHASPMECLGDGSTHLGSVARSRASTAAGRGVWRGGRVPVE